MKKLNKRYKDHDICSIIGTRTIISQLNNYVSESISHLKEIQNECNQKENFNPENLYLPVILICDASSDIAQHKLDLLKSSLDRYLFADEDFKQSSIKHDKITKTKRLQPIKKFKKCDVNTTNFPKKLDIQSINNMEVDLGDDLQYQY
jgi:hypothetical protein